MRIGRKNKNLWRASRISSIIRFGRSLMLAKRFARIVHNNSRPSAQAACWWGGGGAARRGEVISGMRNSEVSPYLSTPQAAEVLGVSVSTVKRWVDDGVLPAQRTAGGHRKLLRAEVLDLVRRGALPRGDLAAANRASPHPRRTEPETAAGALLEALLRGGAAEAQGVLRHARDSGMAMEIIADQVVAPAMFRVGEEWRAGRLDVWREHRATQLCVAALYPWKAEFGARAGGDHRPIAIGGAPEGDPYLLASLLAQLALLESGWEAVNLGPNTPLPSLANALRELRPRLLWLSVSYVEDLPKFLSGYQELYRIAEELGVAVAVGGQGLTDPLRSAMAYTTFGDGLSHLAAFARALNPRPKPPRRGRPPKTQTS